MGASLVSPHQFIVSAPINLRNNIKHMYLIKKKKGLRLWNFQKTNAGAEKGLEAEECDPTSIDENFSRDRKNKLTLESKNTR